MIAQSLLSNTDFSIWITSTFLRDSKFITENEICIHQLKKNDQILTITLFMVKLSHLILLGPNKTAHIIFKMYDGNVSVQKLPLVYTSKIIKNKVYTALVVFTCIDVIISEPWYGISNNVVCATSKASDQPAHTSCTCSLIRAFASRLNIL